MDSLGSILGRKDFDEPPEIALIKDYVLREFRATVEVVVRERDIAITSNSAALANTLRLRTTDIKQLCQTDKRLLFRIS